MKRKNLLARLFRALSGKSQGQLAEEIGVHPSLVGQWELGQAMPSGEPLKRLAGSAGLTVEDGEELLDRAEALRRRRHRRGLGTEDLFQTLTGELRHNAETTYRSILTLPLPDRTPQKEDRHRAGALWAELEPLDEETRLAVVRSAEEHQSWELCERVCKEALQAASRDVESAAGLARLAQEIADRVRGPEGWRNRVRGFAMAHGAKIRRLSGDLQTAEAGFREARRLWSDGADPASLLDPGELLELERGPSSRIRRPSSPFEGANLERKPRFTSRKRLYEGRKPRITSFKRPYEGRKPWIRSRNPRFASLKRAYEGRKPGITALEPRIRSLDPRRAGRSNLLGHTSV
jgi:transcriptional regulator with XRE-family HTH domain